MGLVRPACPLTYQTPWPGRVGFRLLAEGATIARLWAAECRVYWC